MRGSMMEDVAGAAMRQSFTAEMAERGEQRSPTDASYSPRSSPRSAPSPAPDASPTRADDGGGGIALEFREEEAKEEATEAAARAEVVDVEEEDYMQLPLKARVALETAQEMDGAAKLAEAYEQYSLALKVCVPWLQANEQTAEALKPMLSVVFKRAFELRAEYGKK